MAKQPTKLSVETLTHDEATRVNIPTAEYQSVMRQDEQSPIRVAYERRNRDLDPQLVWRGKDEQDWSDLVVHAPPIYIQEKVHPKALIDDLVNSKKASSPSTQIDLFADFNGIPEDVDKTDFYRHEGHWSNRMILGDSLQVMASLAEREGLRGKVQCIYFDPPYGIKFNSNFQWSTTSRDVKDGNMDHITREPEQVKAFRDTWRDGIHSYLTYLRDRLTVARDLLTDSGSIFVQIGDENVHRVRAVMDEVLGCQNFISLITTKKSGGMGQAYIDNVSDYILWYGLNTDFTKYRPVFYEKNLKEGAGARYRSVQSIDGSIRPLKVTEASGEQPLPEGDRIFLAGPLTSETASESTVFEFILNGHKIKPRKGGWKTSFYGMQRLLKANRLLKTKEFVNYKIFFKDFAAVAIPNLWEDTMGTAEQNKLYVVQTTSKVIQRCVLMTTDPGDLVLDPTCGSGTTAYVAEQWGRRWITVDTSRVALALARARLMGARYPYYLLADSRDGQLKEADITRTAPSSHAPWGDIRQGFVYERVPHITLKSIANNAEIDVIWEKFQDKLEPLRKRLSKLIGQDLQDEQDNKQNKKLKSNPANPVNPVQEKVLEEWEIPREANPEWPEEALKLHTEFWHYRIARQQEIDVSIAAKANSEYLYDKPYEDKKKVRVAGPFTVESLSPHRVLTLDENDELIDPQAESKSPAAEGQDFVQMILDNLKTAGVQQAHKEDKINFSALTPWPGEFICAEGRFRQDEQDLQNKDGTNNPVHPVNPVKENPEQRAAIFIGPEFGTVSRPDLVAAAREAGDAGFDVLIACAFNYDAHSSEFAKLGRIPVLKARMNADLHMADDLKNTGKGNLFVIFGEPDIDILDAPGGQVQVKVNGVDVFHPNTGEVRSDGAEGIACWFIDTDYNEESFFVRHAYFLGANDPYKSLKTTLKAEINEEAWATLNSDTSRPFAKPKSGRIAVKVINHLGDEVMKVFKVN
ncbi:MAG: DNA methyltransferase [Methylococcus sp.]